MRRGVDFSHSSVCRYEKLDRGDYGQDIENHEIVAAGEVHRAQPQPLQGLRSPACLHAEVRRLPYLLP